MTKDIVDDLRYAQFDGDNMPRMESELCVSAKLAEEAANEIERLRRVIAKDPKTIMMTYESGRHRDLVHAIADKDEIITAHEQVINDQQAEIEGLRIIIKDLERRLEHAEWLIDEYRREDDRPDDF